MPMKSTLPTQQISKRQEIILKFYILSVTTIELPRFWKISAKRASALSAWVRVWVMLLPVVARRKCYTRGAVMLITSRRMRHSP